MSRLPFCLVLTLLIALAASGCVRHSAYQPQEDVMDSLARLKPEAVTSFSNGGWSYDRYPELPPLLAGSRMPVADLEGPGIIRALHTTRHQPFDLFARGIVLEIVFDNAERPAVLVPLADFFADGCNGEASDFSAQLVECGPVAYNAWFPMPFRERAQVFLRNDTDQDAMNYSFVEWEKLPEWDPTLGYFHAAWDRRAIQLTGESNEVMLNLKGSGHLVGRQFSVLTDEPLFHGMTFVMEGNNEIDIDGEERRIDYLGTEDSFGFSWGFQRHFSGLRQGMPLVDMGETARLSIYRFHDHMPLRFNNSLQWRINWQYEHSFNKNPDWKEKHDAVVERDGAWVDLATVHYWYSSEPGGHDHGAMPSLEERNKPLLKSSRTNLPPEE